MAETFAKTVLSLPVDIPFYTNIARATLALVAVQRGDMAAAQEQYAALEPVSGIMLLYIGTDRVLGLLAQTMGKLDQAMAHFQDALAFCRKAGYRPELARTCYDYADMLLSRNGSGDRQMAMSLLDEALGITRELGMQPLVQRVVARQERLESPRPAAPAYPGGLTHREVEILGLIAAGRSNSEIADKLVLSVRTVERHITNLYAKINARGRADATAYALSHGLARHP